MHDNNDDDEEEIAHVSCSAKAVHYNVGDDVYSDTANSLETAGQRQVSLRSFSAVSASGSRGPVPHSIVDVCDFVLMPSSAFKTTSKDALEGIGVPGQLDYGSDSSASTPTTRALAILGD